jgi:hypothetical protein
MTRAAAARSTRSCWLNAVTTRTGASRSSAMRSAAVSPSRPGIFTSRITRSGRSSRAIADACEAGDLTLQAPVFLDGQTEIQVGHRGLGDQHPEVAFIERRAPLVQTLAGPVQGRPGRGDLSAHRGQTK